MKDEEGTGPGTLLGIRVLPAQSGTGPALVELDKEERVLEGPPVDDGPHQVDEGHDHGADDDEGDEGPQLVQRYPQPVAQAAEPTLLPGVGGMAKGVRPWNGAGGLFRVHTGRNGDAE